MPIRTQCPSCQTALGAPDGPTTQRVRCPFCGHTFTVEPKPAAVPKAASAARPRMEEATRPADDFDIAAARRGPLPKPKRDAVAARSEPQVTVRKSSHLPVGLLVGLGVGVFGLFILVVGGGVLIWLASSAGSSETSTNSEVAQAKSSEAGPGQAGPFAAGPRAVPDAPANQGDEEFVDLPERGEAIPGVAGLNPEPSQGEAGAPAGAPRVVLTGGRAQQMSRQAGLVFHVNYRFEQGAPVATMRYGWVIFTARGRAFIQRLAPGTLAQQGSLEGQIQTNRAEAPFRTFLIAEMAVPGRPGLQQVKISDEMTFR
jgi:uncharacterized Zn finger protein (UPF0148 family)